MDEIRIDVHMPMILVNPKVDLGDGEHCIETKLLPNVEQLDELVASTGQSLDALDAQLLSPAWLNQQAGWRLERLVRVCRGKHPFRPKAPAAIRFEVESGRRYILKNDDRITTDRYHWIPCL